MISKMALAAAATLAATPVLAADLSYPAAPPPSSSPVYSPASMVTGDISLGLGWAGTNGGLDSDSISGFAAGRLNIPFGAGWNETLEAGGLWMFNGDASAGGIFSHTYYKDPAWGGGFVLGYSAVDPFSSGSSGVFTAGVEGVVFLPNASLLGKATYNWADSAANDFWNLAFEGRYYFTPNTKLTGGVSWFDLNDTWVLSAALEHRWAGTGISNYISAAYLPSSVSDSWSLLVGIRFLFDQPGSTLQGHDWQIPFSATSGMPL